MAQPNKNDPSTLDTVKASVSDAAARTEEFIQRAAYSSNSGYGLIVAGVFLLLVAAIILVQALVVALASIGLGAGWAATLVGIALAMLGVFLMTKGEEEIGDGPHRR